MQLRSHPKQHTANIVLQRLLADRGEVKMAQDLGLVIRTLRRWGSEGVPANRVEDVLKLAEAAA